MIALRTDDQGSDLPFECNRRTPPLFEATPSPCRVLVVDDDEWMRTYLHSLLKSANYAVETASSASDAIQMLHAEVYDMLLTDYEMPDMDGLTLCKHVRFEYPNMYVLIFTIKDTSEDRYAGLMAGADEYLIKGDPKSEVLTKMNLGRRIRLTDLTLARCEVPIREFGLVDLLTNAPNVTYFDRQMTEEIQRAQRDRRSLSVLSCRIDSFRRIAIVHGQHAADEALCAFADNTRQCLRHGQDWFARIGEDRFIVVLPNTRFQRAERMASKLRRRFTVVPVVGTAHKERYSVKIDVTTCEPRLDLTPLRGHPIDARSGHNAGRH